MKRLQRGFVHPEILVAFLFIAIVGVVAFAFTRNVTTLPITEPSPTPTAISEIDTSDWKTYRNEEYGFEFKYPSEWKVTNTSSNDTYLSSPDLQYDGGELSEGMQVEVSILNIPDSTTLEQIAEEELDSPIYSYIEQAPNSAATYLLFSEKDDIDMPHIALFNIPNITDKYIKVGLDFGSGNQEIFNQILSTFQFTGPSLEDELMKNAS